MDARGPGFVDGSAESSACINLAEQPHYSTPTIGLHGEEVMMSAQSWPFWSR
jgi:hypothetical protein